MVISDIREDGKPLGLLPDGEMAFHIDQIYPGIPCKAAALHAVEIPDAGGDTMFSNNVRAYESLASTCSRGPPAIPLQYPGCRFRTDESHERVRGRLRSPAQPDAVRELGSKLAGKLSN